MSTDDTQSLYGSSFACDCGKRHSIQPGRVIYADDCLTSLPGLAEGITQGRHVSVLLDARTHDVAGHAAVQTMMAAGWEVLPVKLPDGPAGHPICDEPTRQALLGRVGKPDVVVAAGSGVISDLGKLMADAFGTSSLCVATAASMNGYASANVAHTVDGIKTLLRSKPPAAVLARPGDIERAPYAMTTAGLGDILAKSVSSTDWYMNHLLFGDYYCPRSVGLIARIEPLYFDHPLDILGRKGPAIEALFQGLLLTGVAMTMAETSAPSSGGEHMISHTLDMIAGLHGREHDLHGRQVGVGTVLASELYRRLLALESPEFRIRQDAIDERYWGNLSAVIAPEFSAKRPRMEQTVEKLSHGPHWDNLRAALAPMLRTPQAVHDCLAQAQGATAAGDLGLDQTQLEAAFTHGHEFRARITVLDLAQMAGLLPHAAAEIVAQWA